MWTENLTTFKMWPEQTSYLNRSQKRNFCYVMCPEKVHRFVMWPEKLTGVVTGVLETVCLLCILWEYESACFVTCDLRN